MAAAIIRETLGNAIKSAEILVLDPGVREKASAALKRLPSYHIGSRGELLE
jgi:alpha-L-fucosidase 2